MVVYYAVAVGHKTGLFDTWGEFWPQVNGFKGGHFKSFTTRDEAQAFLDEHAPKNNKKRRVDGKDNGKDKGQGSQTPPWIKAAPKSSTPTYPKLLFPREIDMSPYEVEHPYSLKLALEDEILYAYSSNHEVCHNYQGVCPRCRLAGPYMYNCGTEGCRRYGKPLEVVKINESGGKFLCWSPNAVQGTWNFELKKQPNPIQPPRVEGQDPHQRVLDYTYTNLTHADQAIVAPYEYDHGVKKRSPIYWMLLHAQGGDWSEIPTGLIRRWASRSVSGIDPY